jgi:hypothetical protein
MFWMASGLVGWQRGFVMMLKVKDILKSVCC